MWIWTHIICEEEAYLVCVIYNKFVIIILSVQILLIYFFRYFTIAKYAYFSEVMEKIVILIKNYLIKNTWKITILAKHLMLAFGSWCPRHIFAMMENWDGYPAQQRKSSSFSNLIVLTLSEFFIQSYSIRSHFLPFPLFHCVSVLLIWKLTLSCH